MYQALNKFALQRPVIFWSCVIGAVGPVMVWTVPGIRRSYFGFKGYEPLPITYPLPKRARTHPAGYEDNE